MKRLLTGLLLSAITVIGLSANVSAVQRWTVNASEPTAETTSRTIKVNYNVQSIVSSDTFTVELFENGSSQGTQAVNTPYGDSGVFSVDIPATGTYSYRVTATNHGDSNTTKNSNTYTVEVVDAPEPTVNVVTVQQGGQAAGADATAAQVGGAGAGQVAAANGEAGAEGDAAQNEATDDEAAAGAGDQDGDSDDEGDVLGAEGFADRVGNSVPYVLIAAAIAVLGLMLYRARQAADKE